MVRLQGPFHHWKILWLILQHVSEFTKFCAIVATNLLWYLYLIAPILWVCFDIHASKLHWLYLTCSPVSLQVGLSLEVCGISGITLYDLLTLKLFTVVCLLHRQCFLDFTADPLMSAAGAGCGLSQCRFIRSDGICYGCSLSLGPGISSSLAL